jgi:phosphopantothenoylcysteine decarboxylase/phosphopantothenate--cysteine ligase
MLSGKNIVIGVTGSIAAYKSVELVRRLVEAGASVRVVMTAHAKAFVTPMTFQAVSGHPVHDDLFDVAAEAAMGHIELARWADLILIAPASADLMARLTQGAANDLLTTLCLATRAPILLAPAMNQAMWLHPITKANAAKLAAHGMVFLGPDAGQQACGDVGPGRMREPDLLLKDVISHFQIGELAGLRILMTVGATKEAIDPVRYLTNGSSGKMGFALALAAKAAGAEVTVIHGLVSEPVPSTVTAIAVESGQAMHDEVMKKSSDCDIFLAVAAVADYRCEAISAKKLPKHPEGLTLTLVPNPDIVASVAALPNKPYVVGFAAETHDLMASARRKLVKKGLDMIIANPVNNNLGIGSPDNEAVVITRHSEMPFERAPKNKLAHALIAAIANEFNSLKKASTA